MKQLKSKNKNFFAEVQNKTFQCGTKLVNKTNVQTTVKNLTTKILSKGSKQHFNTSCEQNLLQKV